MTPNSFLSTSETPLMENNKLQDESSSCFPSPPSSSPQQKQQDQQQQNIRCLNYFSIQYHIQVIHEQSSNLISFLCHGTPIWLLNLSRLILFVIFLLPAYIVFAWHYISCDRVAVTYKINPTSRHFLDIYGSNTTTNNEKKGKKPVVVFLTGGAWIIGYKMWGTLLARALVPSGVLVIIPDYRNFPQTNIRGMMSDVDDAMQWILDHVGMYGGDPNRVVLVGQSAGAHIGSCVLLRKAEREVREATSIVSPKKEEGGGYDEDLVACSWKARDLCGFVPVSGPCDLVYMREHFHKHGLDRNIVSAMFCQNVEGYSPTHIVRHNAKLCNQQEEQEGCSDIGDRLLMRECWRKELPPICVIHGTEDKTVPYEVSIEFAKSLTDEMKLDNITTKLYHGWSHTDPILEAPMMGDHRFHRDVFDLVQLWTINAATSAAGAAAEAVTTSSKVEQEEKKDSGPSRSTISTTLTTPTTTTMTAEKQKFDEDSPYCQKICPRLLVIMGRFFNPF